MSPYGSCELSFNKGRLRLAKLAPVVFEALASGQITLDIAKAFGATSDQEIQARVFERKRCVDPVLGVSLTF